jgi:mono/diheme cytochrome c family protein
VRSSTAENFSPARDGFAVDERQRDETGRTGAMPFAAGPRGEASRRSTVEAARRRPRREVSLPRVGWRIVAGLRERFGSKTGLLTIALATAALIGACKTKPAARDAAPSASASASSAPFVVPTVAWDPKTRADAIAAGKAVLVKNECRRCHLIDDLPAPVRPNYCTSCHEFLTGLKPGERRYEEIAKRYGRQYIERYQRNIVHLIKVPDLTGLGRRVRADFIAKFLTEPFDQRPTLEESMIRHRLSDADVRAVARYFAAVANAPDPDAPGYKPPDLGKRPPQASIDEGEKLFLSRGCPACHTFGNVDTGIPRDALEGARATNELAPNLRFAKERTRPDVIVAWIENASQITPGTVMPPSGLTRHEAELVRDFLFFGDPKLRPAPAPYAVTPPKILARTVKYEEMKARTLGKVCVHCHMNDYEKDTGPGNKGGFGYHGIGLAMRTYEALVNGAVGPDGKRYSVLVPRKGETLPPVVAAMLQRRVEEQRDRVPAFDDYERPDYPKSPPAILGMPMGLPSMTDEDISILATWIAQGCKGPTKIWGEAGVNDGLLVRDGPIRKNAGCEQRPPEHPRPKWAWDQ